MALRGRILPVTQQLFIHTASTESPLLHPEPDKYDEFFTGVRKILLRFNKPRRRMPDVFELQRDVEELVNDMFFRELPDMEIQLIANQLVRDIIQPIPSDYRLDTQLIKGPQILSLSVISEEDKLQKRTPKLICVINTSSERLRLWV